MEHKQIILLILAAIALLFCVIWFFKRIGDNEKRKEEAAKKHKLEREAKERENVAKQNIAKAKMQSESAAVGAGAKTGYTVKQEPEKKSVQLVFNVDEAADYLEISQSDLYRRRRSNTFPKGKKKHYKGSKRPVLTFTIGQLDKWDQQNPRV